MNTIRVGIFPGISLAAIGCATKSNSALSEVFADYTTDVEISHVTDKNQKIDTQKQAGAFSDLYASTVGMLFGNIFNAAEVQRVLAESSADFARNMIDAVTTTQREIVRMSLDAMAHGDPVALMTLAPRAAQTVYREGMDRVTDALQTAQSLGNEILGTVPKTPRNGTEGS